MTQGQYYGPGRLDVMMVRPLAELPGATWEAALDSFLKSGRSSDQVREALWRGTTPVDKLSKTVLVLDLAFPDYMDPPAHGREHRLVAEVAGAVSLQLWYPEVQPTLGRASELAAGIGVPKPEASPHRVGVRPKPPCPACA